MYREALYAPAPGPSQTNGGVYVVCFVALYMVISIIAPRITHTIQFTAYCNSICSPSIYVVKMSIMGDIYGHPMHPDGCDHWLPKLRDP